MSVSPASRHSLFACTCPPPTLVVTVRKTRYRHRQGWWDVTPRPLVQGGGYTPQRIQLISLTCGQGCTANKSSEKSSDGDCDDTDDTVPSPAESMYRTSFKLGFGLFRKRGGNIKVPVTETPIMLIGGLLPKTPPPPPPPPLQRGSQWVRSHPRCSCLQGAVAAKRHARPHRYLHRRGTDSGTTDRHRVCPWGCMTPRHLRRPFASRVCMRV